MIPPRHHVAITAIAQRLRRMFDDMAEIFEERAAIREFCGGQSRESAESAALHDLSTMEHKR